MVRSETHREAVHARSQDENLGRPVGDGRLHLVLDEALAQGEIERVPRGHATLERLADPPPPALAEGSDLLGLGSAGGQEQALGPVGHPRGKEIAVAWVRSHVQDRERNLGSRPARTVLSHGPSPRSL
jgi:hypothetical protein